MAPPSELSVLEPAQLPVTPEAATQAIAPVTPQRIEATSSLIVESNSPQKIGIEEVQQHFVEPTTTHEPHRDDSRQQLIFAEAFPTQRPLVPVSSAKARVSEPWMIQADQRPAEATVLDVRETVKPSDVQALDQPLNRLSELLEPKGVLFTRAIHEAPAVASDKLESLPVGKSSLRQLILLQPMRVQEPEGDKALVTVSTVHSLEALPFAKFDSIASRIHFWREARCAEGVGATQILHLGSCDLR